MKIKFEHVMPSSTSTDYSKLAPETAQKLLKATQQQEAKEKELYYEFGIEPLKACHHVKYTIMRDESLNLREREAIENALSSIVMAFDINPDYAFDELWKIVKGDKDACFYEDCNNYDVDISDQGAFFIVAERFNYPYSVKFTGDFIKHFLWAYLTMMESPAAPYSMEVSFKRDWVIFE